MPGGEFFRESSAGVSRPRIGQKKGLAIARTTSRLSFLLTLYRVMSIAPTRLSRVSPSALIPSVTFNADFTVGRLMSRKLRTLKLPFLLYAFSRKMIAQGGLEVNIFFASNNDFVLIQYGQQLMNDIVQKLHDTGHNFRLKTAFS